MRKDYVEKLLAAMKDEGLDAMLISPSEELHFFCGFSPMMCERFQGLFIKQDGGMFYICNLLYGAEIEESFQHQVPVYTWFDGDGMVPVVSHILDEQGMAGTVVGVNSSAQAFNVLELAENFDIRFKNAKPLLEEVRIHKSPEELANMRKVAAITDGCFQPVIDFMQVGMTEAQVRDFLFEQMAAAGGSEMWAIVASGPNSGFPHYSGCDRVLQDGDCIVLDFGCVYNGMRSDMSRTVFMGHADEKQKRIYQLVNRAQQAAQDAAVEGAWIPDIDRIARDVLDEQGYAATLINRVGHGLGYMIHEAPDIKGCNLRRLERGMCFTIEPGVYLPNVYGMRVENVVCINEQGETEVLNHARRDLVEIH